MPLGLTILSWEVRAADADAIGLMRLGEHPESKQRYDNQR